MASAALQWMCIRKNNSFLVKGPVGSSYSFSKEPNNIRNRHTFRYSGLVHKRTVGIEELALPTPAGEKGAKKPKTAVAKKGVNLVLKKAIAKRKPKEGYTKVSLKKDGRRTLRTISRVLKSSNYRLDLRLPAMRRASALLAAQRRAAELAIGKGVKKTAVKGRGKSAAAAGAAAKARKAPKEKRNCKIRVLGTERRKLYIDQRV